MVHVQRNAKLGIFQVHLAHKIVLSEDPLTEQTLHFEVRIGNE